MDRKQEREAAIARQRQIVDEAKADGGQMGAAAQAEFDTLQRRIDQLTAEINAEEKKAASGNAGQGASVAPETGEGGKEGTGTRDMEKEAEERARAAERARAKEITGLCRSFGFEPDKYIEDGLSIEQVRSAVLDRLCAEKAPLSMGARMGESGEDEFRRDAADGLLRRGGVEVEKPSAGSARFMGMSMRELAVFCLEREGVSNARYMGADDVLREVCTRQFYNPTASFPAILDNAINKAYVEGHRTAAVTFDLWTKKGSLRDFKVSDNNYLAGPIGDFQEVPEGGELKSDVPVDKKLPTRRLRTYGKQFTLTRQAFINDDIGLVTRIPARHAAAARRTINNECYKILMKNPKIYDDTPLFDAKHNNLLRTGTGITKEAVQAMILALSTQKDDFDQPIIVRPGKIIVPAGMMFDTYTLFNSPYIHTEGNTQAVNPLYAYRDLQVIEDPTINLLAGGAGKQTPWFMTANSEDTAFIEVDYLNGQEIPTIRRMETPGQLGFVWDIWLDWGVNVMDYRGAVKNPGVVVKSPLD